MMKRIDSNDDFIKGWLYSLKKYFVCIKFSNYNFVYLVFKIKVIDIYTISKILIISYYMIIEVYKVLGDNTINSHQIL